MGSLTEYTDLLGIRHTDQTHTKVEIGGRVYEYIRKHGKFEANRYRHKGGSPKKYESKRRKTREARRGRYSERAERIDSKERGGDKVVAKSESLSKILRDQRSSRKREEPEGIDSSLVRQRVEGYC